MEKKKYFDVIRGGDADMAKVLENWDVASL